MGLNPETGRHYISDAALSKIYLTISRKEFGASATDLIVATHVNSTTICIGLRELRDMGCIKNERRGQQVYYMPTNHRCEYCA